MQPFRFQYPITTRTIQAVPLDLFFILRAAEIGFRPGHKGNPTYGANYERPPSRVALPYISLSIFVHGYMYPNIYSSGAYHLFFLFFPRVALLVSIPLFAYRFQGRKIKYMKKPAFGKSESYPDQNDLHPWSSSPYPYPYQPAPGPAGPTALEVHVTLDSEP